MPFCTVDHNKHDCGKGDVTLEEVNNVLYNICHYIQIYDNVNSAACLWFCFVSVGDTEMKEDVDYALVLLSCTHLLTIRRLMLTVQACIFILTNIF